MIVSCPHCQKKFKVEERSVGQGPVGSSEDIALNCKFCGQPFSISPEEDRLRRLEITQVKLGAKQPPKPPSDDLAKIIFDDIPPEEPFLSKTTPDQGSDEIPISGENTETDAIGDEGALLVDLGGEEQASQTAGDDLALDTILEEAIGDGGGVEDFDLVKAEPAEALAEAPAEAATDDLFSESGTADNEGSPDGSSFGETPSGVQFALKNAAKDGSYFKVNSMVSDLGKRKGTPQGSDDAFIAELDEIGKRVAGSARPSAKSMDPMSIADIKSLETEPVVDQPSSSSHWKAKEVRYEPSAGKKQGENTDPVLRQSRVFSHAIFIKEPKSPRGMFLVTAVYVAIVLLLVGYFCTELFPEIGLFRGAKALLSKGRFADGTDQLVFTRAFRGTDLGYPNLIFIQGIVRNRSAQPKADFEMRISFFLKGSEAPQSFSYNIGDPLNAEAFSQINSISNLEKIYQANKFKTPLQPAESRPFVLTFYDPDQRVTGYRIHHLF